MSPLPPIFTIFPYTTLFRSAGYNETYFNNSLPKKVHINYNEHDNKYMATTTKNADGTFNINFNTEYVKGERVVLYTLLHEDRKSTRLNSSHSSISYAVFCLK